MRKLVQSVYDADPRFARERARRVTPSRCETKPQPAPREFRYVEPRREKVCRRTSEGPRCGLAYAAGYAGLVYLFQFSVLSFFMKTLGLGVGTSYGVFGVWFLWALAAVALGLAAGYKLDRTPGLRGRLPALTGFTLGFVGTVKLAVMIFTGWG